MTKPKPLGERQRRGRKPGSDQDGATWVAIELRRQLGTVGRSRGSKSRALEFLAEDLIKSGYRVKQKTLHNRYYRAAARRKTDPTYALKLDGWLEKEKLQCRPRYLSNGTVVRVINWLPPVIIGHRRTPN